MAGRLSVSILFLLGALVFAPAMSQAQDDSTDDATDPTDGEAVDDDDDNPFDDAASVACLKDRDCDDDQVCRDEGICVSASCESDEDCDYDGYICRKDGICVPENCLWDSDCLEHELCLEGECRSDPAMYVEGGVANCRQPGTGSLVLVGLMLLGLAWSRKRAWSR